MKHKTKSGGAPWKASAPASTDNTANVPYMGDLEAIRNINDFSPSPRKLMRLVGRLVDAGVSRQGVHWGIVEVEGPQDQWGVIAPVGHPAAALVQVELNSVIRVDGIPSAGPHGLRTIARRILVLRGARK